MSSKTVEDICRELSSFEPYLNMLGLEFGTVNGNRVILFQKKIQCIPIQSKAMYIYQGMKYEIPSTDYEVYIGVSEKKEGIVALSGRNETITIYQSKKSMMVEINKNRLKHLYEFHPSYLRLSFPEGLGNSHGTFMFGPKEFPYVEDNLLFIRIKPAEKSQRETMIKRCYQDPSQLNVYQKFLPSRDRSVSTIDEKDYKEFVLKQMGEDKVIEKELTLLQNTLPEFFSKMVKLYPYVGEFFYQDNMRLSFRPNSETK